MKMAQALDLLQSKSLVHGDINPENISIKLSENGQLVESIKLLDFGSSFKFESEMNISESTAEYLSPEVLLFFESVKKASNE